MPKKTLIFCPLVWVFGLWKKNIDTIIEMGQIAEDYLQCPLSHLFSSLRNSAIDKGELKNLSKSSYLFT